MRSRTKIGWIAVAGCVGLGMVFVVWISRFHFSVSQATESLIDDYSPIDTLPLEKRIATSSVILLTKWKEEGDRLRRVVVEVLKRDPKVSFYYQVGDLYGGSVPTKPNTDFGDGEVLFFKGSPPQFTLGVSYSGDRIQGFGDLPLATLRADIELNTRRAEKNR